MPRGYTGYYPAMTRMVSWNVNGIRSVAEKGFFSWLEASGADIVCIQETKAQPEQLKKEFFAPAGYASWWASAEKKGYSGVATYSRIPPKHVDILGDGRFDAEGRVLQMDFGDFVLFNCYFPNSQDSGARIDYKIAFCETLKSAADKVRSAGKTVVICGDYNIAHKPLDLEHPDANRGNPGYLPRETDWMDGFIGDGYLDTFRKFHPEPRQYSWWSYRTRARERNIGWRIDYFCTDLASDARVAGAAIHADVTGSDHCPVSLDLE